jgi:hypothetical protein
MIPPVSEDDTSSHLTSVKNFLYTARDCALERSSGDVGILPRCTTVDPHKPS